jgi:hypothetical protein
MNTLRAQLRGIRWRWCGLLLVAAVVIGNGTVVYQANRSAESGLCGIWRLDARTLLVLRPDRRWACFDVRQGADFSGTWKVSGSRLLLGYDSDELPNRLNRFITGAIHWQELADGWDCWFEFRRTGPDSCLMMNLKAPAERWDALRVASDASGAAIADIVHRSAAPRH